MKRMRHFQALVLCKVSLGDDVDMPFPTLAYSCCGRVPSLVLLTVNLIRRSEAIHHVCCLGQAQLATSIVVQGEQLQAVLPFCRLSACSGTVAHTVCPIFDLPRFLTNTSLVVIILKSLSHLHHQQAHSFAASWRALPCWPPYHNYSMLPCSGAGPADTFKTPLAISLTDLVHL